MYGRGSFWRCSRFWRAWTEREQYSDPLQFQSRAQDRLTNVAVWIVNHLSEDLSVEHLAEKVNVCHDILAAYLKILSAIPPRISWKTPARRSTRLLGERAREIRRRSSHLIVRVSTQYYTLQTRPPERRRRRSASSLLARRRVLNVSFSVLCLCHWPVPPSPRRQRPLNRKSSSPTVYSLLGTARREQYGFAPLFLLGTELRINRIGSMGGLGRPRPCLSESAPSVCSRRI
jgi:hypothetical protein